MRLPVSVLALVVGLIGCASPPDDEEGTSESELNGQAVVAQIVGSVNYGDAVTVPYQGHRAAMRLRVNAHDVVHVTLTAASGAQIDTKVLREASPGKLVTIDSPDTTDARSWLAPNGTSYTRIHADTFEDLAISFEIHGVTSDTIAIAVTTDGSLPSMTLTPGAPSPFVAPAAMRSCYQTVALECDSRTPYWVTTSPGSDWTPTDDGAFRKRVQASVGIGVSEHAVKWYHAQGVEFGPAPIVASDVRKDHYSLDTMNGHRLTLQLLADGSARVEVSGVASYTTCVGTLLPSPSNASANPPDPCPDM